MQLLALAQDTQVIDFRHAVVVFWWWLLNLVSVLSNSLTECWFDMLKFDLQTSQPRIVLPNPSCLLGVRLCAACNQLQLTITACVTGRDVSRVWRRIFQSYKVSCGDKVKFTFHLLHNTSITSKCSGKLFPIIVFFSKV